MDCAAKVAVLGAARDGARAAAINALAFADPVRTPYGFLDRGREAAVRDGDGDAALLRMEPSLAPVLGAAAPRMNLRPFHAAFDDLVRARAEAFRRAGP